MTAGYMETDWRCINTVRVLAADTVQRANSGHPGAPMGLAPLAHVLFTRAMRFNPKNSQWPNRDRFVLSNGHSCALQYVMLHLLGYKVTLDDLKAFRQLNSKTPGHPENTHTDGVEVTTGPLGQGIANAVGLAIAEAHLAAQFNQPGFPVVDNYTFAICGDGCLQEGVSAEAASLAGHLGLGKLIILYDDNNITIDGETEVSFTEDVLKRFESYGFHTLHVEDGNNDLSGIEAAIEAAKKVTDKPSLIKVTTIIGFGSKAQGTEKVHGAPLGNDDVAAVKSRFGFDPTQSFIVPEDVKNAFAEMQTRGAAFEKEWQDLFARYMQAHPQLAAEFVRRVVEKKLPVHWRQSLPVFTPNDPEVATRKLSETVLNKIAPAIPELVGGSADLTGSNLTKWKGSVDFQRNSKLGNYSGRYFRFGVREHGMFAILNGMAAYGGLVPFGATFLNFISYGVGAVRLSALSHFRVIYIMTHDSIGLGEDGPTHQPIETLAALRAIPNLLVLRPADGNEVSGAYAVALEHDKTPSVLCFSRQNLPQLEGSSIEAVARGGYILNPSVQQPELILVGTGSEVSLIVEASRLLTDLRVRLVSMPCTELFDQQAENYRVSIFPAGVPVLSCEAMTKTALVWRAYSSSASPRKRVWPSVVGFFTVAALGTAGYVIVRDNPTIVTDVTTLPSAVEDLSTRIAKNGLLSVLEGNDNTVVKHSKGKKESDVSSISAPSVKSSPTAETMKVVAVPSPPTAPPEKPSIKLADDRNESIHERVVVVFNELSSWLRDTATHLTSQKLSATESRQETERLLTRIHSALDDLSKECSLLQQRQLIPSTQLPLLQAVLNTTRDETKLLEQVLREISREESSFVEETLVKERQHASTTYLDTLRQHLVAARQAWTAESRVRLQRAALDASTVHLGQRLSSLVEDVENVMQSVLPLVDNIRSSHERAMAHHACHVVASQLDAVSETTTSQLATSAWHRLLAKGTPLSHVSRAVLRNAQLIVVTAAEQDVDEGDGSTNLAQLTRSHLRQRFEDLLPTLRQICLLDSSETGGARVDSTHALPALGARLLAMIISPLYIPTLWLPLTENNSATVWQSRRQLLDNASLCLSKGDIHGATEAVNSLDGAARRLVYPWLCDARRWLEIRQALNLAEADLMLGELGV